MENSMVQYFQTQVWIPQKFINMFIARFNVRDKQICCCQALKYIYGQQPTRSNRDQLIRSLKKLNKNVYSWEMTDAYPPYASAQNKNGQMNGKEKQLYTMTYKTLMKLQILKDVDLQDYLIELESLLFKYTERQLQNSIEEQKQNQLTIEENKKEISKLKHDDRLGSIYYIMKPDGSVLYVGKDKSKNQGRVKQHLSAAKQIKDNYQKIDIQLALIDSQDINIESDIHKFNDIDEIEKNEINVYKPKYNQTENHIKKQCKYCTKQYIYARSLDKHTQSHNV